jgi:hypothetical protein
VEYGLFSGFFMNKFACTKKMVFDIFLIFCSLPEFLSLANAVKIPSQERSKLSLSGVRPLGALVIPSILN